MEIRMLKPLGGYPYPPGTVKTSPDRAINLILNGYAEAIDPSEAFLKLLEEKRPKPKRKKKNEKKKNFPNTRKRATVRRKPGKRSDSHD